MNTKATLNKISLVSANFGNGVLYKNILLDWFSFLGGKPGEVVIVDGGSDIATQAVYWELFQEGLIDKLQIIKSEHEDNNKDRCYLQEYTAAALASKPYLLFFKIDTLPYREGHDNWLEEAINYLDRNDVFAVSGALNRSWEHHKAWAGWYFCRACTINFCLIKRSTFMQAMQEFAGEYINSGFIGESPTRFLLEKAFIVYMKRYNLFTLCKVEDSTWSIFHTNAKDENLKTVREKYLAREDIDRYLNPYLSRDFRLRLYYGQEPYREQLESLSPWKRLRVEFGQSFMGVYWRRLKTKFSILFS